MVIESLDENEYVNGDVNVMVRVCKVLWWFNGEEF